MTERADFSQANLPPDEARFDQARLEAVRAANQQIDALLGPLDGSSQPEVPAQADQLATVTSITEAPSYRGNEAEQAESAENTYELTHEQPLLDQPAATGEEMDETAEAFRVQNQLLQDSRATLSEIQDAPDYVPPYMAS